MRSDTALGLIFADMHNDAVRDGTSVRSFGSLPFGGRYRLIDFVLSNMVNAGIAKVGVITKSHYQSLMDHLGSGKAWDLSRKNEGLFFLPPHSCDDAMYHGRIDSLADVLPFLLRSKEETVVLSDCHMLANLDLNKIIRQHIDSGAHVTVACRYGAVPPRVEIPTLRMDAEGRVTDLLIGSVTQEEAYHGIGVYVMQKDWLVRTVQEAMARNLHHFERDVLQSRLQGLDIRAYEVSPPVMPIYSLESYYRANLAMLDDAVRAQLFPSTRPVYTKLRDCAPTQYGLHAQVENSLIADGARIDGVVKNCVIFRGVSVARDAVLENCVIMQDVTVDRHCRLSCVMADKNVVFREGRTLQGFDTYPVYVRKNTIV